MKKKFKFLIGASVLVASSVVLAPLLTSCKNQTTSSSDDNTSSIIIPGQGTFIDNTYDYKSKINNPDESNFNKYEDSQNWQDFHVLTKNANSEIYNKIFESIDANIVTNDVYNMITTLGKNSKINSGFFANVSNINIEEKYGMWGINVQFELYNSLTKENKYKIGHESITFGPKTKKNIELKIFGELKRTFYTSLNNGSSNKIYFGYYFPESSITYDDSTVLMGNFKLNNYSLSLNKYLEINNDEVGYTDIEEFATQKMMEFSNETLKNEIENTYDIYLNAIGQILEPIQKLLQELIKSNNNSISLLEFLKINAENCGLILNEFYKLITKNEKINIKDPIILLLSDQTLSKLIVNKDVKTLIIKVLDKFQPEIAVIASSILESINEDNANEKIDALFDLLKELSSKINVNGFSKLISDLKTKGLLTSILENIDFFKNILSVYENEQPIISILSLIINNFDSNNIFDFVLNLLKIQDENNQYVLKNLLTQLIPNKIILEIINQILFDNPNLTKDNFVGFIDVFANPMDSNKNGGKVVNLKDWFNSIEKTKDFNINNDEIEFKYKFTFKGDIYFNIDKLLRLLPNSLSVGTTNIPIGLLAGALPDWISINDGDYIEITHDFEDIEYDVVNIDNQYELSWQAFTHTTIDVNLPKTLKTIYDSTFIGIGGSTLVNMLNNVFYNIYSTNFYFKPFKSSLNKFVIENYNPKLRNNQAIFINEISNERLAEIKKTIEDSIEEVTIDNTKFVIAEAGWISSEVSVNKNKTVSNIYIYPLLAEYFNFDNYNWNCHIDLDINIIIKNSSILGYEIPGFTLKNIGIQTPYNVYTTDGEFKNYFSINF